MLEREIAKRSQNPIDRPCVDVGKRFKPEVRTINAQWCSGALLTRGCELWVRKKQSKLRTRATVSNGGRAPYKSRVRGKTCDEYSCFVRNAFQEWRRYRFSAFWLRSKCSICSYQLNIWYVPHWGTSILNWFLDTDEMSGACSALVTGWPGIAVPPGSAHLTKTNNKPLTVSGSGPRGQSGRNSGCLRTRGNPFAGSRWDRHEYRWFARVCDRPLQQVLILIIFILMQLFQLLLIILIIVIIVIVFISIISISISITILFSICLYMIIL